MTRAPGEIPDRAVLLLQGAVVAGFAAAQFVALRRSRPAGRRTRPGRRLGT
ncbi:hypothetical protein GCU60_03335 [Blastococcus saxobsidens]|uniref:Uncharacterized protein n=1 Tax=Blastococcus saxobsidens TaxID=138336 RepID=A0A6L9W039_9ACTN|nr:hypothetical protein [Blastococcus saxobsidens]NEK84800.1 hypothetical protein [Blastococcus saxobsidens]